MTLTRELRIVVPGHPAPKGSLKCIGGRGGKGGAHVLIEDNARTKDWRATIANGIRRHDLAPAGPGQPVGVEVTFTLERPKAHYGTGRNAGTLKERFADARPVGHQTGDTDKLVRLVLDALQDADLIPDDSAVVEVVARKEYVAERPALDVLGHPGAVIRLYPIQDEP